MEKSLRNLQNDLKDLFAEGVDTVHILADFDGTLTKEFLGGKKVPSIISVLRDHPGYLSPDYQEAAKLLHKTYRPFEHDTRLTFDERRSKMKEWWTRHNRLLIESGLTHDHLAQVANSGIIEFKEGAKEFLKLTKKLEIPVVIFSASGLGEAIPIYCHHEKTDFSNIHFLINRFVWDSNGKAIGHREPIIHSLNKDETILSDYAEIHEKIKNRVNVLLLGNGLGDLGMIHGFKAKRVVSIGFLDSEEKNLKPDLEKSFQHVVIGGYQPISQALAEFR